MIRKRPSTMAIEDSHRAIEDSHDSGIWSTGASTPSRGEKGQV
jgi:hypothetical protein